MKKRTDKERLDWLADRGVRVNENGNPYVVRYDNAFDCKKRTREMIDAAMEAQDAEA